MPLHIIGAGLCRTGTSSLKAAIEQLDLGPCYHMKENFLNQDSQKWVDIHDAVRAGKSLDELKEMFEAVWQREEKTYKAAVDYPSQVYYKQLADIYPDAKVILTERDSPTQWYESTSETVGAAPHVEDMEKRFASMDKQQRAGLEVSRKMLSLLAWDNPDTFNGKMHAGDQQYCEDVYTKWNEGVKQSIPAERLLVFNAKQGWQPLCEFLGVPVPEGPFPKLWDKETFKKVTSGTQKPEDFMSK